MKRSSSLRAVLSALKGSLVFILLFAAIAVIFVRGLRSTAESEKREALRIAEESVRRAAVSCYATEGRYPESYEYIREHCGVRVNGAKYIVHYEIFASNIMPDISVTER